MAVSLTFLPARVADILNYASQVNDVVTADGFVPASIGWSADDVTAFTALVTAAQTAFSNVTAANAASMAATNAFSGTGQALEQLVQKLRDLANQSRASAATDNALLNIGISRRTGTPTPVDEPTVPPEFTLFNVLPGIVNVRFREAGSGNLRKKLEGAIGVQVAVVNGATAPVEGEADAAPNVYVSRSPAAMVSAGWPTQVRLYARWVTRAGKTGPWSPSVAVHVL